ncbi:MAG: CHASE3 domain-containing protein, partial [Panacagrimonas sp.]
MRFPFQRADDDAPRARGLRFSYLPLGTFIALLVGAFAVALIALLSARSLHMRTVAVAAVERAQETLAHFAGIQADLNSAESGKRGFLLTGEDFYLVPFATARADMSGRIKSLRRLTAGDEPVQAQLDQLEHLAGDKFDQMEKAISHHRAGRTREALAVIRDRRGKDTMDAIHEVLMELARAERQSLALRQQARNRAVWTSFAVSMGGSAVLMLLIVVASLVAARNHRVRQSDAWVRAGQAELVSRIQAEMRLDQLGEQVLQFLAEYMDARVGAAYLADRDDNFRRFAAYAVPLEMTDEVVRPGQGLLGEVLRQKTLVHMRDVPAQYLPVSSATGRADPQELLLCPAKVDGIVHAVIELGFLRAVGAADLDLLARVSDALGVAVRSSKDRTRLEELLEETQRQSEELQTQQEELRVSNEELEEQGRALKVSAAQLESQQVELEQTNSQLEEQMQMLEAQRDDLARA